MDIVTPPEEAPDMPVTRTRAALRIIGRSGTVAELSAVLGTAPTDSHDIGHPRSKRDPRPWPHLYWGLDSTLPETAKLEEHLGHLCDRLQSQVPVLQELHDDGYLLDWYCFVETDEGQGGLVLSPALLARLGTFPVDLGLDLYG